MLHTHRFVSQRHCNTNLSHMQIAVYNLDFRYPRHVATMISKYLVTRGQCIHKEKYMDVRKYVIYFEC